MEVTTGMDWWEWTNLVANVVAAIATVIGLIFAGVQLLRAARAAERTADSVRETRILELLRAIRDVEKALDDSTRDGREDRSGAERAALDWRLHAAELHGLLARRDRAEDDPELLERLRDSITVAARTKGDLVSGSESVSDTTEKLRAEVTAICDRVGLVGSDISALRVEREV